MGDIGSIEVTDGDMAGGGVEKQLVGGESDILLTGENNAPGTFQQCRFELFRC